MASGIIASITGLLSGLPANAVLRERVALLKDQAEGMEKRVVQLEDENRRLQARVRELEANQAHQSLSNVFVEHSGALFKRKAKGGFERVVYCPTCRRSTFSLQNVLPFSCDRCQWSAAFNGDELDAIMKELE